IFSRFARRPDGVTGTGLGLSIVSLLVERYRGLISVEDRIPGDFSQGACFQISFPKVMNAPNEMT
ncbi:MAG: histidine kinase, partial [Candidatus Thermoplasmatota archaeon]|nr:histidine kinase [Candidatus Thermoplasmatota archaeon]